VSFKGVSSASSKRLSKTLSETGSNPTEPQHFAVFATILYGWLWRVHSSKQATKRASTPDPQLRSKRYYGNDSVEAGWDHHFVHSSMHPTSS